PLELRVRENEGIYRPFRYALRYAQGACGGVVLGAEYVALGIVEVVRAGISQAYRREVDRCGRVELRNVRGAYCTLITAAHGKHLIDVPYTLGLVGVHGAGRRVIGEAIAERQVERLDCRHVGEQRKAAFQVDLPRIG